MDVAFFLLASGQVLTPFIMCLQTILKNTRNPQSRPLAFLFFLVEIWI